MMKLVLDKKYIKPLAIGIAAFLIGFWSGQVTSHNKIEKQLAKEQELVNNFLR